MEREEFIKSVRELDKNQGNYPLTRKIKASSGREELLKSVPQIVIDLFEYLRECNINVFVLEKLYDKSSMFRYAYLFLPETNIYIHAYDSHVEGYERSNKRIFLATCHNYYPFFIDINNDSLEWTISKLKNCIASSKKHPKRGTKEKPIIPVKRKRQRIQKFEKVERNDKAKRLSGRDFR